MDIMMLLVPCSLLVSGGFLFAFLWATRSGQFDDTSTPAIRMLFDEPTKIENIENDEHQRTTKGIDS